MRRIACCIVTLSILLLTSTCFAEPIVVHEWGTFTSLQDEDGKTIAGINSDDEPVPGFCHNLRWDLIQSWPSLSQGVPRCHPDVTMRLETPVMYFHLPKNSPPITLNVSATFNGGWLTQFYPDAKASAGGLDATGDSPGHITSETTGTLTWTHVHVGGGGKFVETNDHVWTTPRNVDAATVTVTSAQGQPESEKYLFYRGVGHLDSPVTATQKDGVIELVTRADFQRESGRTTVGPTWIARFDLDGSVTAQAIDELTNFSAPARMPESLDGPAKLDGKALRAQMKQALVKGGLFDDEAQAMLDTWELSYFKSPGTRVFFIVPQHWVDEQLPIKISAGATLKRVMIGRLELITPRERALIRQIADANKPTQAMKPTDATAIAFENLGRFRNALLLDELRKRPNESLRTFIQFNGLEAFSVPTSPKHK